MVVTRPAALEALTALAPVPAASQPISDSDASHPVVSYLVRLTTKVGRDAQKGALARFAADLTNGHCDIYSLPWAQVTFVHVVAAHTLWTEAGAAPAPVNARLSAVQGTMREAWRLNLIETDRYMRIKDVENVKGSRLPSGRALSTGEIMALFSACAAADSYIGCRDAAMLAVMYGTGLRRAELTSLTLADWNAAESRLTVIGKGNRERALFLFNGSLEALTDWLEIRGSKPGYLFGTIDRHGNIQHSKRTSGQAVAKRIAVRADEAKIAPCSPHDFRRTHVSDALANGGDLPAVSRNAGHANPQTTMRYGRRGERAQRKAAEAVHVPFQRPARRRPKQRAL